MTAPDVALSFDRVEKLDADRSAASRELLSRFEASDNFTIVGVVRSTSGIDDWLERGDAWMALSIPPDYGATVARGETASIQVVADGTDSPRLWRSATPARSRQLLRGAHGTASRRTRAGAAGHRGA